MKRQWNGLAPRQKYGGCASLLAVMLTFVLAAVGTGGGVALPLSLAIAIALFQFGAAWAFAGYGKATPSHAQASVRSLFRLGERAAKATALANEAYEQANGTLTPTEMKARMGILSSQLSYIQENAVDAIDDWRLVHPQAVKEYEERSNNGNS